MGREFSDAELMRRAVDGRLLDVRTTMAAEVVSFDANTMTATVKPGVRVQVTDSDSRPEVDTLSNIEGVPVLFPSMGPFILYSKLSTGDIVRLEASEEDDSEVYDDAGASLPVNPTVLKRHGGAWVCRPEGTRGTGVLGAEDANKTFIGRPEGVGMTMDGVEIRLGDSSATEYVALAGLLKIYIDSLIINHTHTGVTPGGGFTGIGSASVTPPGFAATKVKAI